MTETEKYIQLLERLTVEGADHEGYRPAFRAAVQALRDIAQVKAERDRFKGLVDTYTQRMDHTAAEIASLRELRDAAIRSAEETKLERRFLRDERAALQGDLASLRERLRAAEARELAAGNYYLQQATQTAQAYDNLERQHEALRAAARSYLTARNSAGANEVLACETALERALTEGPK